MIKKIALFLLFFCYCPVALASAWDAFTACFNDFCNCGDSNATIREPWNDEDRDPFKRNRVCAPWNKDGGRDEHTW